MIARPVAATGELGGDPRPTVPARVPAGGHATLPAVELQSDRRWVFPAPPQRVWQALADTGEYRRWWPWLTSFEAGSLAAGERWHCTVRVRPPLPYSLRFDIHLDEVVCPRLVTADVSGDIVGRARLDVHDHDAGAEVRLTSALAPSSRGFAALATVARPIVRRGHDWVLDTGARQFLGRAIAGR